MTSNWGIKRSHCWWFIFDGGQADSAPYFGLLLRLCGLQLLYKLWTRHSLCFFTLTRGSDLVGKKTKSQLAKKNGEGAKILSHILASYGLILLNSDEFGELASQRNLLNLRQFTSDIQSITESRCALVNGWCFALGETTNQFRSLGMVARDYPFKGFSRIGFAMNDKRPIRRLNLRVCHSKHLPGSLRIDLDVCSMKGV